MVNKIFLGIIGITIIFFSMVIIFGLDLLGPDFQDTNERYFDGYNGYYDLLDYNVHLEDKDITLNAFNNSKNITIINISERMRVINIDFKYNMGNMSREELSRFSTSLWLNIDSSSTFHILYYTPNPIFGLDEPIEKSNEIWYKVNSQMEVDREIVDKYTNSLIMHIEEILNLTPESKYICVENLPLP